MDLNKNYIYFDNASTTMVYAKALETFTKVSKEDFGNDSSIHALGLESKSLLERARSQVSRWFNFENDCIFTSGATESNNTIINSVAYKNKSWANKLITTTLEHPSVLKVFERLQKEGFNVKYISVDKNGNLDYETLEKELDNKTSLVSIMAVNNEVGFIFDTNRIYSLIKSKSKAYYHTDATQAIGKIKMDLIKGDFISFSGHKIGAIKGIGAIIKNKKVTLDPFLLGGSQESNLRAGTTNVAGACCLASAINETMNTFNNRFSNALKINEYLRNEISKIDSILLISNSSCSPFILSFALLDKKASVIAEYLSERGIYVSTKSACSERTEGYSYVISSIGYDMNIASNTIRLSFTGNENIEQCNIFIKTLREAIMEIKNK